MAGDKNVFSHLSSIHAEKKRPRTHQGQSFLLVLTFLHNSLETNDCWVLNYNIFYTYAFCQYHSIRELAII